MCWALGSSQVPGLPPQARARAAQRCYEGSQGGSEVGAQAARLSEWGLGMATPEIWLRLTLKVPRHGATRADIPAQPGGLQPNWHHMDRRTTEVSPAPWDTRGLCFRTVKGIELWSAHRQPREDTAPPRLTRELVGHRRGGATERTTRSPGWCRLGPQGG